MVYFGVCTKTGFGENTGFWGVQKWVHFLDPGWPKRGVGLQARQPSFWVRKWSKSGPQNGPIFGPPKRPHFTTWLMGYQERDIYPKMDRFRDPEMDRFDHFRTPFLGVREHLVTRHNTM